MNPFLASAILLILRWLQFIGSQQVLGRNLTDSSITCIGLIEDTKRFSDNLSNHALNSNGMSSTIDINGKVM